MRFFNRYIGRKKVTFSREQAMSAKPIRNGIVQWARDEAGEVHLSIPRNETRFSSAISRIFPVPEQREMALDEIGSLVWDLCDGNTTIQGIVDALRERYKLNRRETEASVTQYLKTLAQRGLIGFQIEGGQP